MVAVPDDVVAAGRASLDATGLFVLGEPHGVVECSWVAYTLARRLGTRGLALEQSYDDDGTERNGNDGRYTLDRDALVEALRPSPLVLVDRLGSEGAAREREMAERLLAQRDRAVPTLVVVGALHASLEGDAMAAQLARELPGLRSAFVHVEAGQARHHGLHEIPPRHPPGSPYVSVERGTPSECATLHP